MSIQKSTTTSKPTSKNPQLSRVALARQFHALGFNVLAVNGNKTPLGEWGQWHHDRQALADVHRLPWRKAKAIGAVCGVNGMTAIDFDKLPYSVVAAFLEALALPHNYAWVVRSPGGGWHVWVRCDLPFGIRVRKTELGDNAPQIEVRHTGHQTILPPSRHPNGNRYQWAHAEPSAPPTWVEADALIQAQDAHTIAPEKPQGAISSDLQRNSTNHTTGDGEKWLAESITKATGGQRDDVGFWLACQLRDDGLSQQQAESLLCQYADAVTGKGDHAYTHSEARAKVRSAYSQPARPKATRGGVSSHSAPTAPPDDPVFTLPNGMSYGLIGFLNFAHNNKWLHVERGDVPNMRGFAALLYQVDELQQAGALKPDEPVTANRLATLSEDRRGLSRDTISNALAVAEYCGFCSLYCFEDLHTGFKSPNIRRGRPGKQYIFRSITEAWQDFISKLEPYIWRALMVEKYSHVPTEATDFADWLQKNTGATWDDIGVIDDASQCLYEAFDDDRRAAIAEFNSRVRTLRGLVSKFISEPPVTLPADVTFSKAREWYNALNEWHMGNKEERDSNEAARFLGVSLGQHRRNCEAQGIIKIPEWSDPVPVASHMNITAQAERLDAKNYYRGRVRLYAGSGDYVHLSPNRSTSHYADWLAQHGGIEGAEFRVWERSVDKRDDDRVTDQERADRAALSERSAAFSERAKAKRETDEAAGKEPPKRRSRLDTYMQVQGELRAELFGLTPMPEHQPVMLTSNIINRWFDLDHVWEAIVQTVKAGEGNDMPTFTAYSDPETVQETDDAPVMAAIPSEPSAEPEPVLIERNGRKGFYLSDGTWWPLMVSDNAEYARMQQGRLV